MEELNETTAESNFLNINNSFLNSSNITLSFNDSFVLNVNESYFEEFGDALLPNWIIGLYFSFVLIGSAIDIIYVLALSRCKRNGTFSLLLQLSMIDAVSPLLATIEILTINNRTWTFSQNTCPIYNGTEILLNSLELWIIICINFHVISLWNLFKNESQKKSKNPLIACDDESNECLVTKRENTRVMCIDYRRRRDDISVAIPSILIWLFCTSLSIPSFTLSSTRKIKQNFVVCALVDKYYDHMYQILLLVFRVLLPVPLLLFSLIFLIVKLSKTSLKDVKHILTKDFAELRVLLIFCICFTILYLCTSFQRNLFQFLHLNSHVLYNLSESFKVPPLYNNYLNISSNMSLTMLHYSCNTLRAVLLLYLLPEFKKLIRKTVLVCNKR